MKTNKIQWKRISEGEELPCDSLLMRYDGTITRGTCAGVKEGQDAYYLPLDELKKLPKEESEDKKMIQYFEDLAPFHEAEELYEKYGFSHKEAIAWIEKQCEHKKFLDSIQVGDKVTRNEDGVLVNLSQLNRVAKKDEKQGEKRSKLVDFDLNANDSDLQEATYFIPMGFHAEIDGDKVVIKRGEQKPANSSDGESNFKDNDWVVNLKDNSIAHIIKVETDSYNTLRYTVEHNSGNISKPMCAFADAAYRLWTIEDAKDGDVLVSESTCGINTWYCIFKSLDGDESMTVYCYLARDGRFETKKELCFDKDPFNTKPATKEQRDTLIKAMADAGYTFDFEKKELRKIEQKPAENEELTEFDKAVGVSIGTWNPKSPEQIQSVKAVSKKLLKLAKKQINDEQKPWSEEDEEIHRRCICAMRASACGFPEEEKFVEQVDNWLKDLKDRVGCEANCTTTWKPSGEQMAYLAAAIEESNENAILKSLYQDLMKLRKE